MISFRAKRRGFTLIELLVVIAIISLLSGIVFASLNTARAKARDVRRIADMRSLQLALEIYYDNKGYYPVFTDFSGPGETKRCNTNLALSALVVEGLLTSVPTDPINRGLPIPRLCYEYMSYIPPPGGSSWYCSGKRRTEYPYAIIFSTEEMTLNFPRLTDSGGTPNNQYVYCLLPI